MIAIKHLEMNQISSLNNRNVIDMDLNKQAVAFQLMNAGSSNKKTNYKIRGKRVIFTGTSIYKREAVSNKNIGLVARIRI